MINQCLVGIIIEFSRLLSLDEIGKKIIESKHEGIEGSSFIYQNLYFIISL